jgi:hypothetical protein
VSDSHDVLPEWIKGDPAYKDAVAFAEAVEPGDDIAYEWVWSHARELYTHYDTLSEWLDGKAGSIVSYLGGGAGLFTIASLALVATDRAAAVLVLWSLPALVCALASLVCAALARQASWTLSPPTVVSAFNFAGRFKSERESRTAFLGQWHLAVTVSRLVCARKASLVNAATWLYVIAVGLLFLPLAAAAVRRLMA